MAGDGISDGTAVEVEQYLLDRVRRLMRDLESVPDDEFGKIDGCAYRLIQEAGDDVEMCCAGLGIVS